jgi:hypothetical protein
VKKKNPVLVALLSILPPYLIYWFYDTGKQLETRGAKMPPRLLWLLVAQYIPLLIYLGFCLAMWLGLFDNNEASFDILIILALVSLLALFFLSFLSIIYYYKFGVAVEQVTNTALSKIVVFLLFYFVFPVGVFLTQNTLNKLSVISVSPSPLPPVVGEGPSQVLPAASGEATNPPPPTLPSAPSPPTVG